ncbi:hypothetical protein ACJX0J_029375 [Zea mays]
MTTTNVKSNEIAQENQNYNANTKISNKNLGISLNRASLASSWNNLFQEQKEGQPPSKMSSKCHIQSIQNYEIHSGNFHHLFDLNMYTIQEHLKQILLFIIVLLMDNIKNENILIIYINELWPY